MKVLRGLSRNYQSNAKTLILIAGFVNRCILFLPCILFRDRKIRKRLIDSFSDDDETLTEYDELLR